MQSLDRRQLARATVLLYGFALYACGSPDSVGQPVGSGGSMGRVDRYSLRDVTYPVIPTITYEYAYQVYVPSRYDPSTALPLLVMVHGCGTTADEQMHANQLNELAEVEGFLVMYPDNGGECWRAVLSLPDSTVRGTGGDADLIVEMTQATMNQYNVDPERVSMIGMSSGGFQTTAAAAAYPEIFAAVGVNAAGGYGMNVGCVEQPDASATAFAPLAITEMGVRARVIPFFSIGGTIDPLGEGTIDLQAETPSIGGCSRLAFIESMTTNNLLTGGVLVGDTVIGGRYALDSSSTQHGQVPGGYPWTKYVWRDTAGCEIGERWVVEGLYHYWSGGTSDPQWSEWTDPKGPSASRAAWEFFRRFRKSDTGNECAESR